MTFQKSGILFLVNKFLGNGHERSVKAKQNIAASFLIKGGSILISLILVPVTINYVNASRYGIWLTLSSIVGWFAFFDIGLTQGLRNKFAEAVAKSQHEIAQIYVSTTYAILAIIFLGIWLLFLAINPFLNWSGILNVSESYSNELSLLAIIIFTYFCLTFVFKIITTLLTANQEPAKASLIELIGQFLSLAIVIILVKTTEGSIVRLGLALCVAPVLVLLGATIYFFQGKYRDYRPEFKKVNFRYAKGLFGLGIVFFFIQLANIFQFQTANIIIARYYGTADVTAYNIVFKYFGVLLMVFTIFLTPFWSASTEAYLKNEIDWIRRGVRKYAQLSVLLFLGGCLMLVFSSTVYRLWLGENKVHIDFSLSLFGFLFFATSLFGGTYVSFLNGINALRIQLLACIFSPFLYVISALVLIKYLHLGVYSLYIAAILSNFNTFILAPLQYYQVVIKEKKGIWIR